MDGYQRSTWCLSGWKPVNKYYYYFKCVNKDIIINKPINMKFSPVCTV